MVEQRTQDTFQAVVEFYRAYIERNETFEEFTHDVNTLGGTFELCKSWIDTDKTHATISDRKSDTIIRYTLKSIWDEIKSGQQKLFDF